MENEVCQCLKRNNEFIEFQNCQNQNYKWRSLVNESGLQLEIQEQKKFFKSENGWQWYKNLVIPSMKITTLENKTNSSLQEEIKKDSQIALLCYKKLSNQNFEQVALDGVQRRSFYKGKSQFKSLKFEETSFMSRSQYFILCIVVYNANKLLSLYISPKLSVDARKKYWQERQTQGQIFDPFLPKYLESITHKNPKDQDVHNSDLSNLYKYFTCSTIRHKIRHPFFLLFKFPNAIRLFFNKNLINPEFSSRNLLLEIQKAIYTAFKNESEIVNNNQKPVIVQIRKEAIQQLPNSIEIMKYVDKYLGGIDSPAVNYYSGDNGLIQNNFKELEYSEDLVDHYCKDYSSMIYLKFLLIGGDENDSNEEENAFVKLNKLHTVIESDQEFSLTKELNKKIQTIIDIKPNQKSNKNLKRGIYKIKAIHPQIYQEEVKKKIKSLDVITDENEIQNNSTIDQNDKSKQTHKLFQINNNYNDKFFLNQNFQYPQFNKESPINPNNFIQIQPQTNPNNLTQNPFNHNQILIIGNNNFNGNQLFIPQQNYQPFIQQPQFAQQIFTNTPNAQMWTNQQFSPLLAPTNIMTNNNEIIYQNPTLFQTFNQLPSTGPNFQLNDYKQNYIFSSQPTFQLIQQQE